MCLPQLEQTSLYLQFNCNIPAFLPQQLFARETHLPVFLCPSTPYSQSRHVIRSMSTVLPERYAAGSYAACWARPALTSISTTHPSPVAVPCIATPELVSAISPMTSATRRHSVNERRVRSAHPQACTHDTRCLKRRGSAPLEKLTNPG